MWNLNYGTNEPIYKTETDSQDMESRLMVAQGDGGGNGMDWSSGSVDANEYIWNEYAMRARRIAQGTKSNLWG